MNVIRGKVIIGEESVRESLHSLLYKLQYCYFPWHQDLFLQVLFHFQIHRISPCENQCRVWCRSNDQKHWFSTKRWGYGNPTEPLRLRDPLDANNFVLEVLLEGVISAFLGLLAILSDDEGQGWGYRVVLSKQWWGCCDHACHLVCCEQRSDLQM